MIKKICQALLVQVCLVMLGLGLVTNTPLRSRCHCSVDRVLHHGYMASVQGACTCFSDGSTSTTNANTKLWNAHSAFPGCIKTAISPLWYRQRVLLIHNNQIETGVYLSILEDRHTQKYRRPINHLCLYTHLPMLFSHIVTHSSYPLLCVGVS